MSSYVMIPLVETMFCSVLLVVLLVFGSRHAAQRAFAFFLGAMAAWGIFIFSMRAAADLADALLWEKLVLGAILTASVLFYRFNVTFTGGRPRRREWLPLYLGYLVLMALIPSGLVVNEMQLMWYGKAPVIGPAFFPYVLGVYVPLVLSLVNLIRYYRRSRVLTDRTRSSYIITGLAIMFIGGTTDYLPPLGVDIYPLGIIGNILFCVIATVAMLRHGLLEIRLIARRAVAYLVTAVAVMGVFGSVLLAFGVRGGTLEIYEIVVLALLAFVVAVTFNTSFIAIQRLVDRVFFRQRYRHLQGLMWFMRESRDMVDISQLTTGLASGMARALDSRGVYVMLPEPPGDNFTVAAASGPESSGDFSFAANSPIIRAMKYQRTLIDSHEMEVVPLLGGLTTNEREILSTRGIELSVPLLHANQLLGVLLIGRNRSATPYSSEDRKLLQRVSSKVAVSIDHALNWETVQQRQEKLQDATDGLVRILSRVMETRDPFTATHQRRVAVLAQAIAREMKFTKWQQQGVRVAALLHDIGKIGVPSEILSKPGQLTEYEYNIVKTHCATSVELLGNIEFPWPVIDAVSQHHERLDGSGYPDGLSGDDVILEARILAVADVVEAMSSHRPYRPALGLERALEEVSRGRGLKYDKDTVDACLKVCREQQHDFEQLLDTVDSNRTPVTAGVQV